MSTLALSTLLLPHYELCATSCASAHPSSRHFLLSGPQYCFVCKRPLLTLSCSSQLNACHAHIIVFVFHLPW